MESSLPENSAPTEAAPEPSTETIRVKRMVVDKVEAKSALEERAVVYSYPLLIYIWPVILLGYAFWVTDHWGLLPSKMEAWIYAVTVVVVVLTIGTNVNRNMAVFWIVVISAVGFCIAWLRDAKGFLIFDRIGQFFADLNPEYSADFGMLVSIFLTVIYAIVVGSAKLNDKWVFTPNEIEHYAVFRGSNSLGRGAKGVSASYKDFFELLLLLAGDLTVRTAQGNRTLAKVYNVPFLWFRMRKIDRILSAYAVTPGAADEEASEHPEEETL